MLRIATLNIRGGRSRDGRESLSQTAEQLRNYDLVGLNEVHGVTLTHWEDQVAMLRRQLGVAGLFAPAERRWWRDDWGNAVLTTLPITAWQRTPLPTMLSKGFRNYLLVTASHRGRPMSVLITHLDPSGDRDAQMRIVLDRFTSLAEPAILLGDLNASSSHPMLRQFLDAGGAVDALGEKDASRIDWILVRGFRVLRAGTVDTKTSDHPMCWAEVEPLERADAGASHSSEAPGRLPTDAPNTKGEHQ